MGKYHQPRTTYQLFAANTRRCAFFGNAASADKEPAESYSFHTETIDTVLAPYGVETFAYYIYFPESGAFTHAAETLQEDGRLVGKGVNEQLVVAAQAPEDEQSWQWISQRASLAECIDWIQARNISALSLKDVAWRGADRDAYEQLVTLCEERGMYVPSLWRMSIHHRDRARMQRYLQTASVIKDCGPAFMSAFIHYDPVDHGRFERLDFAPLVPGRAHNYDGEPMKALAQRQQYKKYLYILAHRNVTDGDRLALACEAISQEHISVARELFSAITDESVRGSIQYAYVGGYIALRYGEREQAADHITANLDAPDASGSLHWQERLAAMQAVIDNVSEDKTRGGALSAAANEAPAIQLSVEGRDVFARVQGTRQLTVRCYPMNVEVLFSRAPFMAGDDMHRVTMVRPAYEEVVTVVPGDQPQQVNIPDAMKSKDYMVTLLRLETIRVLLIRLS